MKVNNLIKLRCFVPLFVLLFLIVFVPSVLAVESETAGRLNGVGNKPTGVQQERRQKAQNRLTEAKLRACQAKEKALKKRTEQLVKLAATMQEKFEAIAGRVEEYYTSKVIPSGKTVANYDSLLADIQTKKGAVKVALTKAQSNAGSFSCTSDDPKEQMRLFKDDMRMVKSALNDYRTSIKNLIVAVHSVTGITERDKTVSPKPTRTGGDE